MQKEMLLRHLYPRTFLIYNQLLNFIFIYKIKKGVNYKIALLCINNFIKKILYLIIISMTRISSRDLANEFIKDKKNTKLKRFYCYTMIGKKNVE
jgi:hypothetical protein